MIPGVILRDARPQDLAAASQVMLDAFAEHIPAAVDGATPAERDAYARRRADVADVWSRLDDSDLIVAEDAGHIAGAVTLVRPGAARDPDAAEPWPATWSVIRLLAVAPARRGCGLGRALTEECIRRARARGVPCLALHTTAELAVARAMYVRMGWARAPRYDYGPLPAMCAEAFALDLTRPIRVAAATSAA